MDPPNKRRRLAPKLPDSAPSPKKAKASKTTPSGKAAKPARSSPEQMRLFTAEPSTLEIRDAEICASTERHDFETFAKHLQDAAMYIYRQGQRLPYAKVSALLLMWEEDSSVEADLSSLERTLHDRYHFHTERWKIPTVADPGALLSSRISKFVGPSNLDHLSIIYYIGSGQTGLDNQLYWSCNSRDDSPRVNWSVLRSATETACSNVLFLLDSCAPRQMPFLSRHGVKQVIAAYASDAGPRDPSKRSFTSFLVESLQNLGTGRPFSTQHLYDDIIAIQQSYERHYPTQMDFSTLGQPPPAISHVPLFLALTPNKSTIDLSLMPRRHGSSKIQNGGGGNLSQSAGDDMDSIRDTPVISPAAVADAVFNEPRLLVCTTFVSDPGPDMTSFNQWIANTPSLASKVSVEGMFLGPPTVLLISIPQSLWAVIQDANICFSLGYINSHNLINFYDGLINAPPPTRPASVPTPSSLPNVSARDIEDGRTLLEAREAAVNNSPPYRNEYHNFPHHPQQQRPSTLPPMVQQQPQQLHSHQYSQAPPLHSSLENRPVLPPPAPSQLSLPLPSTIHAQQSLPFPVPKRLNSHSLPSAIYRELGTAGHYDSIGGTRREYIPQIQEHPGQKLTSPPHVVPLPPIVSRSGSPILAKNEREDSEEMKEAAEQLKALSHVRPANGYSPPSFDASSSLTEIAQYAIKCRADDSTLDEIDLKRGDDDVLSTKKSKQKKENRSSASKLQDGQPVRSRSKSDISVQPFANLQSPVSKLEVQCDRCHEPFKDHSALRKHVASAHTRPFPCAFSFAGCSSTFGSKNEWKRHIASQHLCLQYYRCSDCSQGSADGKGNEFNRKDLFTQHLRRMHAPPDVRKAIQKRDTKVETQWEEYVKEMQKTCCIVRRLPPQRSTCPRPECNRLFDGRSAWDEWTEHVGRHMENGEGDFLGVDKLLISWALHEGIISQTEDGSFSLCNSIGSGNNSSNNASNTGNDSILNGSTDEQSNGGHLSGNGRSPPATVEARGEKSPSPQTPLKPLTVDVHNSILTQPGEKTALVSSPSPTDSLPPHSSDSIKPKVGSTEQAAGLARNLGAAGADATTVSACAAATDTAKSADFSKGCAPSDCPINEANARDEHRFKEARGMTEPNVSATMQLPPSEADSLSGFQSTTIAAIAAAASL